MKQFEEPIAKVHVPRF